MSPGLYWKSYKNKIISNSYWNIFLSYKWFHEDGNTSLHLSRQVTVEHDAIRAFTVLPCMGFLAWSQSLEYFLCLVSKGVFYNHLRIFPTFSIWFLGRPFLNISNGSWCNAFYSAPFQWPSPTVMMVNCTPTRHHGLNSKSHSGTWCFDVTRVLSWNLVQIIQHAGQPIIITVNFKSYIWTPLKPQNWKYLF